MKRFNSTLNVYKPLKAKKGLNRASDKQKIEIRNRTRLKAELLIEFGNKCMTCHQKPDWRGISLSHIIPLSRGGETSRKNCLLECYICHSKFEKHPELREL